MTTQLSIDHPLEGIAVGAVAEEYHRRHLDTWSDRSLVAAVGSVVSTPKAAPADSFVLHAPLELLARAGLLPHVRAGARTQARQNLVRLAAEYEAAGEPVPPPAPTDAGSVDEAAARLVHALERGDLDDVDRLASWLGARATPADLRRLLAGPVVSSLAAAAHASILLWLLPRAAAARDVRTEIVRGAVRELARYPDWRLRWFEDPSDPVVGGSLTDALLEVPMLGTPGSDFIFPIMSQAEESGIAAKLLTGVATGDADVAVVRRQLSRVAAWSMLQEPPDHAPYGWSHCLTMPQAVMGLAGEGVDARAAVAVASTHVVGFRAALGRRPLVPGYRPEPPAVVDVAEAVGEGPDTAAAAAWHALDHEAVVSELATRASLHHDAHLAKYTLACFDAAEADPTERPLYLAAAASLAGWWAIRG